ncbi:hypothetical protein JTE90_025788 [Oedothorax gibbosus]|uniref:Uncharacterized protein n=1 Tax=Oedothorax gibbosus TaxID=931172 RepID=A0AAV6V168_9ARAC|nr:hypothetical protein JTE90_025788 [Oedothorax gibbosus]
MICTILTLRHRSFPPQLPMLILPIRSAEKEREISSKKCTCLDRGDVTQNFTCAAFPAIHSRLLGAGSQTNLAQNIGTHIRRGAVEGTGTMLPTRYYRLRRAGIPEQLLNS